MLYSSATGRAVWRATRIASLARPLAALSIGLAGIAAMPHTAAAVGSEMFSTAAASTGEKPQSKLWYHDGSYWGVLQGPNGVAIYEKVGSNWVRGTYANAVLATSGQADVKWNGTNLFVLNYTSSPKLFKYTYDASQRIWVLVSGFPVSLPKPSGSETMVLEQDSTGRLWTTAEGGGNINVYYSTSADQRTWTSSPIVLRSGVNSDDISSIVAFGGNKVGVFWSDQNRWEFGFRVHNDSDAPTTWAAEEVVYSGDKTSDDHVNLAFDSQGRVYAITKDATDHMRVHRRATNGNWTTKQDVLNAIGTRGIIMVAEADSKVYILYTRWGVSPDRIEYRVADIGTLSFGNTTIFISSSSSMNNVTGMKQILPPGSLIAVAENGSKCLYNSFGNPPSGGPAPPAPPQNLTATLSGGGTSASLGWSAPTTGSPDGYNVYRALNGAAFGKINGSLVSGTSYTDNSIPTGQLCYQVVAVKGAQQSSPSNTACVDNSPTAPGAPTNLVATLVNGGGGGTPGALLDLPFDEGSGQQAIDQSGNGNHARLGTTSGADTSDPLWVAGKSGTALQFDGSADFAEVLDSPSLDPNGSFTIAAWVRWNSGSSAIVNKGDTNSRTYRVRISSTGELEFLWEVSGGSNRETIAAGVFTDNAWHHVACVYDQAAGQNRVYLDGTLRASSTVSGIPVTNSSTLLIGSALSSGGRTGFMNGAIDGLRIVSGALYTSNFTPSALSAPLPASAALAAGAGGDVVTAQQVQLTWQAPTTGAAAAGYNIYRSLNGAAAQKLNGGLVTTTSWSDGALVDGDLCYTVKAVSAQSLEGPASNSSCVTVGQSPPPPPAPSAPLALTTQLVTTPGGAASGVAAYSLDEGAGQTLLDATGSGHTGLLGATSSAETSDPTWTTGVSGNALLFDGSNDVATVADALDLHLAGSFTIEAWVQRGATGVEHCVLSKGDSQRRNFWMLLTTSNTIDFRWETSGGSNHGTVSTATITDSAWHHVACVYDQAAGADRIYLDGQLVTTTSDSGTPTTNTDPLYIGGRLSAGTLKDIFKGAIDLARVSSGAVYTANFTPPTSFGGGPAQTHVQLAWQAPSSGTPAGYNVYRQVNGGSFAKINSTLVAATAFDDAAPPVGSLCYQVTAVDGLSQEGQASTAACVTVAAKARLEAEPEPAPEVAVEPRLVASPNPFNPVTTIAFRLPQSSFVELAIYDVRGARVTTLVHESRPAGEHVVRWNGRADDGRAVASGAYFALLRAGDLHLREKLILLK